MFLIIVVAGIGAVFAVGVWGMQSVDPDRSIGELRRKFGHTLIPIALAYLVAHYFSLFVFQEQAQFTYLLPIRSASAPTCSGPPPAASTTR